MISKTVKQILSAFVILAMFVGANPIMQIGFVSTASAATTLTESQFDEKIQSLRSTYEDGSTWTGSCHGTQCHGFGNLLETEIFGSYASSYTNSLEGINTNAGWEGYSSVDELYAGDMIRWGGADGHTILVTEVVGNEITFVDCNFVAPNTIRWDGTATLISSTQLQLSSGATKTMTYVAHMSGNTLKGVGSAPTWASVSTSKEAYAPNEEFTIFLSSGGGTLGETYYTLYISGTSGYSDTYDTGGSAINIRFTKEQAGTYTIYVKAYNSYGYVISPVKSFHVDNPPTACNVVASDSSVYIDEEIEFSYYYSGGTPGYTYYDLFVTGDNGYSKVFTTGGNNQVLSFDSDQCGNYEAYVEAYNGGGRIRSEPIQFSVTHYAPTWATINSEKTVYAVGETAKFGMFSGGGTPGHTYYSIHVTSSTGYDETYNTGDSSYELQLYTVGNYTACVDAYNTGGSIQSSAVSFTVADDFTVTFNPTGGTCAMSEKAVTFGSAYGELPVPEKSGCTFNGWFTAETGGNKITEATAVNITSDQVLYAQWVLNHLPGDANGDTAIDLKDVVIIRRYLAGGWNVTLDASSADVNGDNTVDLKDVVILRRYLAGGWGIALR